MFDLYDFDLCDFLIGTQLLHKNITYHFSNFWNKSAYNFWHMVKELWRREKCLQTTEYNFQLQLGWHRFLITVSLLWMSPSTFLRKKCGLFVNLTITLTSSFLYTYSSFRGVFNIHRIFLPFYPFMNPVHLLIMLMCLWSKHFYKNISAAKMTSTDATSTKISTINTFSCKHLMLHH